MATTAPTVLTITVVTILGTPVQLIPLQTAWPSGRDCDKYIYHQAGGGDLIGWDPLYASVLDARASSCLPPQAVSWWTQATGPAVSTYTGLGPTFVCPEAYYPAKTVSVAKDTHETFCCPSQYELVTEQPISMDFPSQCQSVATSGAVLSYLSFLLDDPAGYVYSSISTTLPRVRLCLEFR